MAEVMLGMQTSSTITEAPRQGVRDARNPRFTAFLLLYACCLALIAFDHLNGGAFLLDRDDRLRLLQISDLIADGQWFDLTLPFIAMPEPYVSPWSRLVDLPYVVVAHAIAPFTDAGTALQLATWIWPPAMAASLCFAAVIVAYRTANHVSPPALIGMGFAMIVPLWDFAPAQVDHHNLQLVLLVAMLAGLCSSNPLRGGVLAGASIVLAVSVGLEGTPLIAAAVGAIWIAAVAGQVGAMRLLAVAGATMALSAPVAGLALTGTRGLTEVACDTLSAPWVAALVAGGLALSAFGLPTMVRLTVATRFVVATALGLTALGLVVAAYPACLQGPFPMVDAAARNLWLDHLPQEQSIIQVAGIGWQAELFLLALLIATAALPLAVARFRAQKPGSMAVWALVAVAILMTAIQARSMRFVPLFALLLPLLLAHLQSVSAGQLLRWVVGSAIVPASFAVLVLMPATPMERQADIFQHMRVDECIGADFTVLRDLAPSRIMAPAGVSWPIVEQAPGHAVASLTFHRGAPGYSRIIRTFATGDPTVLRQTLAPYDLLAICARSTNLETGAAPLYQTLNEGGEVPGLELIIDQPEPGLRVYRIDHDRLS